MAVAERCKLVSLLLLLLVLPIGILASEESPQPISHGPREPARIALTFDLCQVPGRPAGFDRGIIEVLQRNQVPATFFLGGDWMRTHPEETRLLAAEPRFELGDHSWSHPDFTRLDAAGIREQLDRSREQFRQTIGREPELFRFPFGFWNDESLQEVRKAGLEAIQWDLVTGDPDPKISAEQIVAAVRRQARSGSIVIMHANGRGRHTAEALPAVLAELRRKGLTPVTVSDLLNPPAPGD